jgi:hypothetical protein
MTNTVTLQNQIFLRYVDTRAIGIVDFPPSLDSTAVAVSSGTCIKVGARFLIATCAHVISHSVKDDLFLAFAHKPQQKVPILRVESTSGAQNDRVDIGCVEVAAEVASTVSRNWVSVTQLGLDAREDDGCFMVYGYPGQLATPRGNRSLHLQGFGVATDLIPDEQRVGLSPGQPDDVLLKYPSDDMLWPGSAVPQLPIAKGMSGGGIWAVRVKAPGFWAPEIGRLVGIQTAWVPGELLRGTAFKHWLLFVRELYADLEDQITPLLEAHG